MPSTESFRFEARVTRWILVSSLPVACAVAGCTGLIGDGDGSGENGKDPNRTDADAMAFVQPADTPLRRLTRTEYTNSVRDLLFLPDGDARQAASVLPSDATDGFDNDALNLKIDDLTMDKYDQVASAVVDLAFGTGTQSRTRLLSCDLTGSASASCARQLVGAFARRAYRRPVEAAEVDELMAASAVAASQGEAGEAGVKLAFRTALVSPHFLFRVEIDPAGTTGPHPVSPHELAVRLSYLAWSTMPDEELFAHADDGTLGKPEVFASQLRRVLDDAKAEALVDNFGAQWLDIRQVADPRVVRPDATVFPTFDGDLRSAMVQESQLFFRTFLKGERNVADMLNADFTFLNERLAKHYGIAGVTGPELRQVQLGPGAQRFGILSQASLLTRTSAANRTSPTRRGKWVMSRILCAAPPPPPPDIPAVDAATQLGPNATIRKQMEKHRENPRCAGCHVVMDPIGFSLEHYDAVGAWRDAYPTTAIDTTGVLPGEVKFDGARELSLILKKDPRFLRCFTKSLVGYALGRTPNGADDAAAIDALAADFGKRGGRMKELVDLVATSKVFQARGGNR